MAQEPAEIPSGLWIIFSGMYRDAVSQFTSTVRETGLIQFGLLLVAFCVVVLGFLKYAGPLIPKEVLDILSEASKDGLAIARIELDRRYEEAKQTETPLDDAVLESLKILHGAVTSIIGVTTSLAQTVAQLQGPVPAAVLPSAVIAPMGQDVARQDAAARPVTDALEMTDSDELDFGDARG